jgi:hypothetical protein
MPDSNDTSPLSESAKKRASAAKIASTGALLIALLRLATCAAKCERASSESRAPELTLTNSPEFSCKTDCYMVDGMNNLNADHTQCEGLCVAAKKKSPDMDFPESMRRCRTSCGMRVLLLAAAARAVELDAGTGDAGAKGRKRPEPKGRQADAHPSLPPSAASSASEASEGAPKTIVDNIASCIPTCIDALATKGEFDPTEP